MTAPPPKRPLWKKKRAWAALALLAALVLLFVAAFLLPAYEVTYQDRLKERARVMESEATSD